MKTINFTVPHDDMKRLDNDFPKSGKSADIGKRALEIVKLYFLAEDKNSTFEVPKDGADLLIKRQGKEDLLLEVKGTGDDDIAWNKLKVSSRKSHDQLTNGLPLYRVTNVFDQHPQINILKYDEDFTPEREDRWKLKQK